MRKGEIACYKQFLLFSPCFPQLYIFRASNAALCSNGLINRLQNLFTLSRFADEKLNVIPTRAPHAGANARCSCFLSFYVWPLVTSELNSRSKKGHNFYTNEFRVISPVCTYYPVNSEYIY